MVEPVRVELTTRSVQGIIASSVHAAPGVVGRPGIEPGPSVSKTDILPLDQRPAAAADRRIRSHHLACQMDSEVSGPRVEMVGRQGIEPRPPSSKPGVLSIGPTPID